MRFTPQPRHSGSLEIVIKSAHPFARTHFCGGGVLHLRSCLPCRRGGKQGPRQEVSTVKRLQEVATSKRLSEKLPSRQEGGDEGPMQEVVTPNRFNYEGAFAGGRPSSEVYRSDQIRGITSKPSLVCGLSALVLPLLGLPCEGYRMGGVPPSLHIPRNDAAPPFTDQKGVPTGVPSSYPPSEDPSVAPSTAAAPMDIKTGSPSGAPPSEVSPGRSEEPSVSATPSVAEPQLQLLHGCHLVPHHLKDTRHQRLHPHLRWRYHLGGKLTHHHLMNLR
jgi:hypothetical protein